MPIRDVAMMVRLADRLEAVERLQAIHDRTVGSGFADRSAVTSHLRFLREKAGESMSESVSVTGNTLGSLKSAGVAVKIVQKGKPSG